MGIDEYLPAITSLLSNPDFPIPAAFILNVLTVAYVLKQNVDLEKISIKVNSFECEYKRLKDSFERLSDVERRRIPTKFLEKLDSFFTETDLVMDGKK